MTTPCNANCNCMRSRYYPVCGRDGVQYFSPCFAGCKNSVSERRPEVTCVCYFTLMRQCFFFYDGLLSLSHGVTQFLFLPSWSTSFTQKPGIKFQSLRWTGCRALLCNIVPVKQLCQQSCIGHRIC